MRKLLSLLALFPGLIAAADAATPLPDPGSLITVPELEQIVGRIKQGPKPLEDTGPASVGCEYRRDIPGDDAWLNLEIFPTERYTIAFARAKFGGKAPVLVPDLGPDAFINPEYAGFSAELFAAKGSFLLRVSLPAGTDAAEKLTAIAKKALGRLP